MEGEKILSGCGILALLSLLLFIFWYSSFYINIFYSFSQNEGVAVISIISFSFFSLIWLIGKIRNAAVEQPIGIKISKKISINKFKIVSLFLFFVNLFIGLYVYNFRNYDMSMVLLTIPFIAISLLSIYLNIKKRESVDEKLKIITILEKIITIFLLLSILLFLLIAINPTEGIINMSAVICFLIVGPIIIIESFILLGLISFYFYKEKGLIASILFFTSSLIATIFLFILVWPH